MEKCQVVTSELKEGRKEELTRVHWTVGRTKSRNLIM